jgi:hypothetical protein
MPTITKGYDFDDTDPVKRVVTAAKLEQLVENATITFDDTDQATFKALAAASGNHKFTGGGIANDTLGDAHLVVNAVTATKIQDGAVIDGKLATDSVNQSNMKTDSVGTDEIIDANITALKLATNSVTTDKILDDNVTAAKINDDVATALAGNGLTATSGVLSRTTDWQFLSTPLLIISQTNVVNNSQEIEVVVAGIGGIPSGASYVMLYAHSHQSRVDVLQSSGWVNVCNAPDNHGAAGIRIAENIQCNRYFNTQEDPSTSAGPYGSTEVPSSITSASALVAKDKLRFDLVDQNADNTASWIKFVKILAWKW